MDKYLMSLKGGGNKPIGSIDYIDTNGIGKSFLLKEISRKHNATLINTFDTELLPLKVIEKLDNGNIKTTLDYKLYVLNKHYSSYVLKLRKKEKMLKSDTDIDVYGTFNLFIELINEMFYETGKIINQNREELEFLGSNDEIISLYKLSSGEKQLLIHYMTVLIQDNEPVTLLLDCPEHNLNIVWQNNLIRDMLKLNSNVQLIIVTNSPEIIMDGLMNAVVNVRDLLTINRG